MSFYLHLLQKSIIHTPENGKRENKRVHIFLAGLLKLQTSGIELPEIACCGTSVYRTFHFKQIFTCWGNLARELDREDFNSDLDLD